MNREPTSASGRMATMQVPTNTEEFTPEPLVQLGLTIRRNVALAPYTTVKIGGIADYFATVTSTEQLLKLVRWARSVSLPYFILGGGSNILISDAGVRGLVIHNRCRHVRLDAPPCCEYPQDERPYLFAESGANMAGVARQSIREGLTGLEWAVSVPGTVGGAVVGNAGAHGGEIKDCLHSALIIDAGGDVQDKLVHEFNYAYRDSWLKQQKPLRAAFKPVVLSANFRLPYGDLAAIDDAARRFLGHRRQTQPVKPSLGSTFINPPGDFAGRLIEAAGLKGVQIGGVAVSQVHANFIVNPGGVGRATAADVMRLITEIRQRVNDLSGIWLETEVQLVGEWEQDESEKA